MISPIDHHPSMLWFSNQMINSSLRTPGFALATSAKRNTDHANFSQGMSSPLIIYVIFRCAQMSRQEEIDDGLVTPSSFIAVAAGERTDTFWFMKVITINQSSPVEQVDDHENCSGKFVFKWVYFLEKDTT